MFASIIAPFGGFFASGFKRGFKIKDFGDSIPGHGGMTDRMDCQACPWTLQTGNPDGLADLLKVGDRVGMPAVGLDPEP